ncbi:MAG TPA: TlpA disulfide reductase family protein [Planctomycetota bacterium]|jgi:peroxiredoxin|nr:TlpA disulfide reductase family protein [Planctomycetota bacterium]
MLRLLAASIGLAALLTSCGSQQMGRRPDWSMKLSDGRNVSASDYDGKVLIVDFWATWCPPCRKEIPGFIKLQKEYGDKGLVVLGFSMDNNPETHDRWVKEQGMNYLSIYANTDEGKAVVDQFQKVVGEISGIPTTLVIDRKGQIVYKHVGYAAPEDFEKVFKSLL